MRQSLLFMLLAIILLPLNANGQTRNSKRASTVQWSNIYNGTNKNCIYYSYPSFKYCPICKGEVGGYKSVKKINDNNLSGKEMMFKCKECNCDFRVRWTYDINKPLDEMVTIDVKRETSTSQTRDHKFTDRCVEGICFCLGNDVKLNEPVQRFAVTRDRRHEKCQYYIEFTISEVGSDKVYPPIILPPESHDVYFPPKGEELDGRKFIVSNARHVPKPEANNQQNQSITPQKSNKNNSQTRTKKRK